jgi:hypothetical protein
MAMEIGIRSVLLALAMTALALPGGASGAPEDQAPTIVIHLTDLAGTGRSGVARAQAEAERILGAAGVRVAWAGVGEETQPGGCAAAIAVVTLMSPEMIRQRFGEGISAVALGSAFPSTGHVIVYSDRVSALAARKRIDASVLLGRVISHEVGHLLLPGPYHSRTGLMKVNMDTDPRGSRAQFTPEQSRAIRALLERRAREVEDRTTCGS